MTFTPPNPGPPISPSSSLLKISQLLTPTHHLTLLQNCRRTYGHMDYPKQSIGNPALLLLFFAGVFYLFIWSSSYRNPFLAFQKEPICTFSNTVSFLAYNSNSFHNHGFLLVSFILERRLPFMPLKMTSKKLCRKLQWQTKRSLSLS